MKKFRNYLIIFTICFLFLFTSCKSTKITIDNLSSKVDASLVDAKKVSLHMEMTDSENLVYDYKKIVELNQNTAVVKTETTKLNSKFELQTTTTEEQISNYSKDDFFNLKLGKSLVTNIQSSKNKISFDVTSENVQTVLNSAQVSIQGIASFEFEFEKGKIINYTCKYTTDTTRQVVITCVYEY